MTKDVQKKESEISLGESALVLPNFSELLSRVSKFSSELGETYRRINRVTDNFAKEIAPKLATLVDNTRAMPKEFQLIQETLAERGWFVHGNMPISNYRQLKPLIDASRFAELDRTMVMWTHGLLEETEENLCNQFPNREPLLREGLENHRQGRYASAITLLLSQGDGICRDILGELFFLVNRITEAPYARDVIDELGINALARIMLHPILVKSGINATDKQIERGEFPDSPHRHPILHGKVTDYISEINSLKIISFVGFMGGVVSPIVESAKLDLAAADSE